MLSSFNLCLILIDFNTSQVVIIIVSKRHRKVTIFNIIYAFKIYIFSDSIYFVSDKYGLEFGGTENTQFLWEVKI